MGSNSGKNIRLSFIENALHFAINAAQLSGVQRIALVGSIATPKKRPKDIDLLVTISEDVDIKALATLGRKLSGKQLSVGGGADVFLANEKHEYLGRTCSYRECHPRVSCEGSQCLGTYIRNDFHLVNLKKQLVKLPPVELYPAVLIRELIPEDLQSALEQYQQEHYPNQSIQRAYSGAQNKNQVVTNGWSNPYAKDLFHKKWPGEPFLQQQAEVGRLCVNCRYYAPLHRDFGLCSNSESRHFTETIHRKFTCPARKEAR